MNIAHMNKIEIKPVGSYLDVDSEGYLINPASLDKIVSPWKEAVDDVIEIYKEIYKDNLVCVYVRGSAAKGQAIENVSDLDTMAFVTLNKEEVNTQTLKVRGENLQAKYPFINGIELVAIPNTQLRREDIIVLNQAVCVWGEELSIPKLRVGNDLVIHANNFQNRIDWYKKFMERETSETENLEACVWLMKGLLRVGLEITIEQSKKYTRDLYLCYQTFIEYFPEKKEEMFEVLNYALNTTSDKKEIARIMDVFGLWMLEQTIKFRENSK